jgi:hypothetical protein
MQTSRVSQLASKAHFKFHPAVPSENLVEQVIKSLLLYSLYPNCEVFILRCFVFIYSPSISFGYGANKRLNLVTQLEALLRRPWMLVMLATPSLDMNLQFSWLLLRLDDDAQ